LPSSWPTYSGVCQQPSQIPEDIFEAIKAELQTKPVEELEKLATLSATPLHSA
jgi:hypothetical protein